MIHDLDIIDALIVRLKAVTWTGSATSCEFVRVWVPAIHRTELKPNAVKVQLWPVDPTLTKPFRGQTFQLTSCKVGVQFALQCESQTREEVDQLLMAVDLLVIDPEGFNDRLFVTNSQEESPVVFYRAGEITWPLRPNAEHLQRIEPASDAEKYSGTIHAQCVMEFRRNV